MRHAKPEAIAPPEPSVDWPLVILSVLTGLFFLVLSRLVLARHNNFYTFDFDLGIYDQAIWLLSHGESFVTVRGLSVFGHHTNFGLLLLVPFSWLGAGPNFLNMLMVAAVALGIVPLYRYSIDLLQNRWHALVPPLAYLAHFATSWIVNETFHPDVLAITPLMLAYLASTRQQWRQYAIWLVLAVIWKEDIALAAFMIGAVVWIRGHRRVGLITLASALVYYVVMVSFVIPALSEGGVFYTSFFGELGSGVFEIIINAVRRPELVIDAFAANDALGYLRDLFFPYAFIPLAGPLAASVALPQFVANMLSLQLTSNLQAHYVAVPLAASSLALVEGFARIRRLALRRFALAAVAVAAAITSSLWGLLPWGIPHDQGNWVLTPNARAHVLRAAVSYPGPDDAVVATYNMVPHLSQRRQIFTFPNPWIATNWGTGVESTPDPDVVDWLLIDRQLLGEMSDDFEQILADDKWEIVFERDAIVVARRGS